MSLTTVDAFLKIYAGLSTCASKCLETQFQTSLGLSTQNGVFHLDNLFNVCFESGDNSAVQPQTSFPFIAGFSDCLTQNRCRDGKIVQNFFRENCRVLTPIAERSARLDTIAEHGRNQPWNPYYASNMTNFDWMNLRDSLKSIINFNQFGPVFVRLAWHDVATCGNNDDGYHGGPHATMMLENPSLPANRGLQRAISAMEPLYKKFDGKISRADLWSYAGAVAVVVMGGPAVDSWQPGRNDVTSLAQIDLTDPLNKIPAATWDANLIFPKFAAMGFSVSDAAALITGAHGIGRAHREYSGYHGPWTEVENTFNNYYGQFYTIPVPQQPIDVVRERGASDPNATSFQTIGFSAVNGAQMMNLPSDLAMVGHFLSTNNAAFLSYAAPGAAGKRNFFSAWPDAYGRLLRACLDPAQLGPAVSTDPTDPFGFMSNA